MALTPLGKRFHPSFSVPGKKPTGEVALDRSNPITRNLQACITQTNAGIWDLVTNAGPDDGAGTRTNVVNTKGQGRDYGPGSDFFKTTPALDSVSAYTFLVVADFRNYTGWFFSGPFAKTSNYGSTNSFQIFKQGGSGSGNASTVNHGGASSGTITGAQIVGSKSIAVVWDGSSVSAFVDHEKVVDTSLATAPPSGAGWIKVCSNRDTHDTEATHYLTLVWDRALSDAEARSVIANPYQVLKPIIPYHYFTTEPAPSSITGTISTTGDNDTSVASGSIFQAVWARNTNILIGGY